MKAFLCLLQVSALYLIFAHPSTTIADSIFYLIRIQTLSSCQKILQISTLTLNLYIPTIFTFLASKSGPKAPGKPATSGEHVVHTAAQFKMHSNQSTPRIARPFSRAFLWLLITFQCLAPMQTTNNQSYKTLQMYQKVLCCLVTSNKHFYSTVIASNKYICQ